MSMLNRGFTLIEILIALAIFAFLAMLAGPMYGDFMGNTQIRNAAENTLNGVRLAQTSAVRNNRAAKFVIDPTPAGGWAVYLYDDETTAYIPLPLETYSWSLGAAKTHLDTFPGGATVVTFDGLGRVTANGFPSVPDGTASLTEVDVTNPSVTTPRALKVMISKVGGTTATKLCDPLVTPPDPRSCS